jgi:RecA-family ATPase
MEMDWDTKEEPSPRSIEEGTHPAFNITWQEKAADNTISLKELMANPPEPPEWLVESLLPKKGLVIIGGAPATFKSTIAAHIGLAVADGSLVFDFFRANKGKVLYINEESSIGLFYTQFMQLGKDIKNPQNVHTMHFKGVKLDAKKIGYVWKKNLTDLLQELRPDLIVLDSMVRFMEGDENDAADVRRVFGLLGELMYQYGGCWLILHHMRKSKGKSEHNIRGSGDFLAMADIVYTLHRPGKQPCFELNQAKCRMRREMNAFKVAVLSKKDSMSLEHMGEIETEKACKIDLCLDKILSWAEGMDTKTFITGAALEEMGKHRDSKGKQEFGRSTIISAINKGCEYGKLKCIKRGEYGLV